MTGEQDRIERGTVPGDDSKQASMGGGGGPEPAPARERDLPAEFTPGQNTARNPATRQDKTERPA